MAYLAAERAAAKDWKLSTKRYFHVGKTLVSFMVSISLFAGAIILGDRISRSDGVHIPIIAAPENWRNHPVDSGGSVTNKMGYALNTMLIGEAIPPSSTGINIVPHSPSLADEDISAREYAHRQPHVEFEWLTERHRNHQRYASSLSTTPPSQRSGKKIDISQVQEGQILVQFGAFKSYSLAENQWRKLTLSFGQHLKGRDWLIEGTDSMGEGEIYRLRAAGFSGWEDATLFCGRLSARGADCSPVVAH